MTDRFGGTRIGLVKEIEVLSFGVGLDKKFVPGEPLSFSLGQLS